MYFWQDIILAITQLYIFSNLKNLINNAKLDHCYKFYKQYMYKQSITFEHFQYYTSLKIEEKMKNQFLLVYIVNNGRENERTI